jgi:hypothetical protein
VAEAVADLQGAEVSGEVVAEDSTGIPTEVSTSQVELPDQTSF